MRTSIHVGKYGILQTGDDEFGLVCEILGMTKEKNVEDGWQYVCKLDNGKIHHQAYDTFYGFTELERKTPLRLV